MGVGIPMGAIQKKKKNWKRAAKDHVSYFSLF